MKAQIVLGMFFLSLTTISCKNDNPSLDNQNFSVKNGTVAGNINIGDFRQNISISATTSNFQTEDRTGKILKNCSEAESPNDWNNLLAGFDFTTFKKLPAINCQNCPALGDIGYEWLEISNGTESYKIQFLNGADIKEVQNLLKIVREKRLNFTKNCQ